jgi:hypothetical protein
MGKSTTVSQLLDEKVRKPIERQSKHEHWFKIETYPGPASGWVHAAEWLNEYEKKRRVRIKRSKEGD